MRGRKPKPTHLKILAGNPGHRPLNENEPQPDVMVPPPPDFMEGEARNEWERITPQLEKLGLISILSRGPLVAYCMSWARYAEAEKKLADLGLLTKSHTGHVNTSPYLWIANKEQKIFNGIAAEFGFTPSSQTRIIAPPKKKKADSSSGFASTRRENIP